MEQQSSSLKAAGSSQKYSATASLSAFSSCRDLSKSASLGSALWEEKKRIQKNKINTSICGLADLWSEKMENLPKERSPSALRGLALCCWTVLLLQSYWPPRQNLQLPRLYKSCSNICTLKNKTDWVSDWKTINTNKNDYEKPGNWRTTLMPSQCEEAGWEKSATPCQCPLLAEGLKNEDGKTLLD